MTSFLIISGCLGFKRLRFIPTGCTEPFLVIVFLKRVYRLLQLLRRMLQRYCAVKLQNFFRYSTTRGRNMDRHFSFAALSNSCSIPIPVSSQLCCGNEVTSYITCPSKGLCILNLPPLVLWSCLAGTLAYAGSALSVRIRMLSENVRKCG